MRIIQPNEFPAVWLRITECQTRGPGNPGTKQKFQYKDLITAFDIESSRFPEIEQSAMYVWQWSFNNVYVVLGRTWDEFLQLVEQILNALQPLERLVCYVHNLSYEFAFLRGIHRFEPEDVFAIRPRKILKALWDRIEFRCSYLHSNMSLDEYISKMGVKDWKKLQGFDYDKIRYPWTELTPFETEYCIHDVVGLVEALRIEMELDGDNLYTIPATSTGYVRREAKAAMRTVGYNYLHGQLPDFDIFTMLREAFRGGDVHANRFFAGQIIHNMHSCDRSSSYPDVISNDKFPVSEFFREKQKMSIDEVMKLITVRGKAVILRVAITNLHLRDSKWPAPYLSRDKCRNIIGGDWDNGRILRADYLETTLTDVDLRIICREYNWTDIVCYDVAHARYGPLPDALIQACISHYRSKTELKGVEGQEVYYTKEKNKLNAFYGMMAQNPCKRSLLYMQDGVIDDRGEIDYYPEDGSLTDEQILFKSNQKAFLAYQWGCWVTAWARYRLREGIWLIIDQGGEWIYSDTDCNKYLGDVDWSAYNAQRIKASKASGAWADDPSGERHYMGVYESESDILAFRTWGAKKYAYTVTPGKKWLQRYPDSTEELICTTAGVGKIAGADELVAAGGLSAYESGFVFHAGGGLEAIYNDEADLMLEVDGHLLHITPNVTLRPSSYTLGLAWDYERLLKNYYCDIDNQ